MMDAALLGEWSRLLVGGALASFVVAWLAFGAEQVARRRERENAASGLVPAAVNGRPGEGDADVQALPVDAGGGGTSSPGSGGDATEADGSAASVRADKAAGIGWSVSILATVFLFAGVLARALAVERAPWANMHEFSITSTLIAAGLFLGLGRRRVGRVAAMWIVALFVAVLSLAITKLYVAPGPLVPALDSYWLVIHVGMAVTAFAIFSVSAVVSGLQIAAARAEKQGRHSSLPSAASLDKLAYRLIAVAFPIWTLGPLILGSIWAEVSWGRYWGWDPKEVWALITWLAYAAYLHARATAGWSGLRASVVSLIGFATLLFSYFAVNIFFNGLHAYGGL